MVAAWWPRRPTTGWRGAGPFPLPALSTVGRGAGIGGGSPSISAPRRPQFVSACPVPPAARPLRLGRSRHTPVLGRAGPSFISRNPYPRLGRGAHVARAGPRPTRLTLSPWRLAVCGAAAWALSPLRGGGGRRSGSVPPPARASRHARPTVAVGASETADAATRPPPRSPSSPRLPWPPRCRRRRCAQRLVGNVPPLAPAVRPSCLAAQRVADRPWRARPLATRRRDPPRSLSNPVASPALPAHHERRYSHCRSRVGGCPLPALPHSVLERSLCPASRHRSPCGPPRCPLLRPFWVGRVALAGCWQWGGPRRRFRDPSHPRARWWRRRQRRQWRRRRRRQCRADSRPDVLDASISPPAGRPCFPLFGEPGLVVGTPHRHCSGRGDAQGCMAAE